MRHEETPWQATSDVFVVTASATDFIDAFERTMIEIALPSTVPGCSFLTHVRRAEATKGPAVVVSDVAEYDGGHRQTAVVVSAVVDQDTHAEDATEPDERLLIVQTHLEEQYTPYEGPIIVFDEHHDAIRAGFVKAVLEVEPSAEHRSRPAPHAPLDLGREKSEIDWAPRNPTERPRRQRMDYEAPPARIDLRQVAGIALLTTAVVVLALAIAMGSVAVIALGVVAAAILGFLGRRVAGA